MALSFENEIEEWQNEGTEPSSDLIESGFEAGYKPSANVFNWFWNKVTKCISEIQEKLSSINSALDDYLPLSGGTITDDEGNTVEITGGGITGTNGESDILNFNTVQADYGNFGWLTLKNDPSSDMQATTKQYVDTAVTNISSIWNLNVPVTASCTYSNISTGGDETAPDEGALYVRFEFDVAMTYEKFIEIAETLIEEGTVIIPDFDITSVDNITEYEMSSETGFSYGDNYITDESYEIYANVYDGVLKAITVNAYSDYYSATVGDSCDWTVSAEHFKDCMFI